MLKDKHQKKQKIMGSSEKYVSTFLAIFLALWSTGDSSLQNWKKSEYYSVVVVDPSGNGDFTTIQAAIDSVPSFSQTWNCIYIKPGTYKEQIRIPSDKPFIYLKGTGRKKTFVVWDAHDSISTNATFISLADNTVAKAITFVNSYNSPAEYNRNPTRAAVAASIRGDKSAFYRCGFFGLQDTLLDAQGRHYFRRCTIQGAIDFIFGAGQSIYQGCTISVVGRALKGGVGFITAQGRSNPLETNGFVFKECKIVGNGKTYLGRPWRDYARVLFYNTSMSRVVVPQGWDAWLRFGHENKLTFAEHVCHGEGSDVSGRVPWEKRLTPRTLSQLTDISFVDKEGWMSRLPVNFLPVLEP